MYNKFVRRICNFFVVILFWLILAINIYIIFCKRFQLSYNTNLRHIHNFYYQLNIYIHIYLIFHLRIILIRFLQNNIDMYLIFLYLTYFIVVTKKLVSIHKKIKNREWSRLLEMTLVPWESRKTFLLHFLRRQSLEAQMDFRRNLGLAISSNVLRKKTSGYLSVLFTFS